VSATAALASPAEDASAVADRWAAAFTANDAEAVVNLYAPDAILLEETGPAVQWASFLG
jgi:ketosteroid isomerase-like protein